jgi:MinD-like ATPase involved in chromosome partitioning or flagellar assembly
MTPDLMSALQSTPRKGRAEGRASEASMAPVTPEPIAAPYEPVHAATGGPLIAVRGLCGGAGASTLAHLLSCWLGNDDERAGGGAILAIDAGASTAGLSLYAGVQSPRSLAQLAHDVVAGSLRGRPFAIAADGLRVIATPPQPESALDHSAVARVIADARAAHRATVVDCGTGALAAQQLALSLASHVIWVLPATRSAADRARLVLEGVAVSGACEIVVARRDESGKQARTRELAALADLRGAPLVLMPAVAELDGRSRTPALETCSVTLQSLSSLVMK